MLQVLDSHQVSCRPFRLSKPALQEKSLACLNDACGVPWYICGMAAPGHDWYLKEWLATLGKKQADIVRDLDWNKARVSLMIRGDQQYTRDAVNEISLYLNLKPYELLMHPQDAMALRRIQSTAMEIAHVVDSMDLKDGTNG